VPPRAPAALGASSRESHAPAVDSPAGSLIWLVGRSSGMPPRAPAALGAAAANPRTRPRSLRVAHLDGRQGFGHCRGVCSTTYNWGDPR